MCDPVQPTGKAFLETAVLDKLRTVMDPEVNTDVVRLGLIRELHADEDGTVHLTFRPTSPVCPLAFQIAVDIKQAALEVEGVCEVEIRPIDYIGASKLQEFLSHV